MGVWPNPTRPRADDADSGLKNAGERADDCMTNNFEVTNAYVTDEMGDEGDTGHEEGDVPPVPPVEEEEARIPAMRRAPRAPTRQEIVEHNLTHLLFRSWSPCSIAAKAKHWPHRRIRDAERAEKAVPSTKK